jgi:hypothetical protein
LIFFGHTQSFSLPDFECARPGYHTEMRKNLECAQDIRFGRGGPEKKGKKSMFP